jgi:hypothetical protein
MEALDVEEYLSELLSANVEPPLPVLFMATAAAVLLCTAVFSVLVGISRSEHASKHGLQGVHTQALGGVRCELITAFLAEFQSYIVRRTCNVN